MEQDEVSTEAGEAPTTAPPSASHVPTSPSPLTRPVSRKTGQPRAMDMDETLAMSMNLRNAVEHLSEKQQEAALKIKGEKAMIKQVQAKIKEYEEKLEKLRAAHEAAQKGAAGAQAELNKQREQHEVLNASTSWTKSALDAALAAQEEYRKGYHSLKDALQIAKDELVERQKEQEAVKNVVADLEGMRSFYQKFKDRQKKMSMQVLERMTAGQAVLLQTTCFQSWTYGVKEAKQARHKEAEMKQTQERLQAAMDRQADQAKIVMERLTKAEDNNLLSSIIAAWAGALEDEKAKRALEARLTASEAGMTEVQKRKRDQAFGVLARLNGGKDTFAVEVAWIAWLKHIADAKWEKEVEQKTKATAGKLKEKLEAKGEEAKKVLARTLADTVEALQLQVLRAWMAFILDDRKERQHAEEQRKKMQEYTQKKKSEALAVMQRMVATDEWNLIASNFLGWWQVQVDEKRQREVEAEWRAECGEQVEALRSEVATATEEANALEEERAKHKVAQDSLENELIELKKRRAEKQKEFADLQRELKQKVETAEDISAELTESRKKNLALKAGFKKLQEMHSTLLAGYDEMLAD
mmetsp:Transcript_44556/g.102878  ORF Transcript_44556/g.102878 Transcript_44556/m.102878 type:complete len:583 (+) Transcript_44556:102-1850(+)